MANLQSEQRLLGVLMQEPTLLLNSEKYLLTNDDFDNKLHQYIFYAISSMAYRGARTLTVQDVELALDNTAGGVLFKRQDGIGLLNDYISLANADNFDTYYRKAKKENLLRDLKESGFDVSLFYDENPLTKERLDINEKYLNMEISEIIDIIQGKILNIESEYVSNEASRTISAADGMRDLIEELAYAPDIGMPYQGKLFNQATAGMRRGTYLVRSADSGVGKTRAAMADACQLAFPITYNQEIAKWERTGYNEKILFIITEQMFKEVQLMMIAYVSNINESKIKKNNLTKEEKEIVSQAISIIEEYTDNFLIIRIPEPTIKVMKNQIRTHVLQHDISYVFFDYIFINPSVLNEFKGVNLRNDEILLMMSTALKDLAIELDIFVATSTQTNSSDQKGNKDIRGGGSIAGAKAIQNKADVGCIMARPSVEELRLLENVLTQIPHEPNLVIDLYKNRGNPTTNVRIWSYFDMGTMRMHDMFVTNARGEAIDIEDDVDYVIKMDEPEFADTLSRLNK